ncbi:UMP-CMP kinase-like protein [Dinothrombium tinctorium]|uniref:UMP-CMP kinase n=1 Tax=Dinothrombium tinctorium TaxID=1965070 RepID=A0A3S4QXL4_9ACAR|nr:UMP-CMP kinase-like protein [Dinothrombium tinctorium]RWS08969.1 UMP-CMP kinase-like protein [Dinothrombium tinctorium]
MEQKPDVVFVLGGPGSGKGTQCRRIANDYNFVHLSAGDLLREERNTPNSQYGELIENHIRNGTIVPVAITCSLLENAMNKNVAKRAAEGDTNFGSGRFLIDGFPRNMDNYEGWQKQMADKANVRFVLYLECPQEVCMERCLKRGQAGSGRSDDNEESMRKRLVTYFTQTLPIIELCDKSNLVKKVPAACCEEEVYNAIKTIFEEYYPKV